MCGHLDDEDARVRFGLLRLRFIEKNKAIDALPTSVVVAYSNVLSGEKCSTFVVEVVTYLLLFIR